MSIVYLKVNLNTKQRLGMADREAALHLSDSRCYHCLAATSPVPSVIRSPVAEPMSTKEEVRRNHH